MMKSVVIAAAILAAAPALAQQPSATEIAEAFRACRAWNGTATGTMVRPGWEHCPKIEEAYRKLNEGAAAQSTEAAMAAAKAASKGIADKVK